MEASAILKMVEDAFYNRFFIIDVIVSNDDRTMRAVLKHPSKGAQGQVLKSSKGKLDEEIPEPSFLADPSHHVKVVAEHIFSILNEIRAQKSGYTKADAIHINKYLGKLKKKQLKSWVRQVRFLLNTCSTVMTIVVQSGAARQEH